jgi:cytochrome c-type biogenesis protein CcmF
MHVAHIGVAVFIVGVTLVTGYESEKDVRMSLGDTVSVGGHVFKLNGVQQVTGPNYVAARAEIEVSKNGQLIEIMHPEKRSYTASGNAMTETAIDSGPFRDLYVSLGEPLDNNAWSVRVYYKPFVIWIWGGAVLMAIGGGLALSDRRYVLAARKLRELYDARGATAVAAPASASARVKTEVVSS